MGISLVNGKVASIRIQRRGRSHRTVHGRQRNRGPIIGVRITGGATIDHFSRGRNLRGLITMGDTVSPVLRTVIHHTMAERDGISFWNTKYEEVLALLEDVETECEEVNGLAEEVQGNGNEVGDSQAVEESFSHSLADGFEELETGIESLGGKVDEIEHEIGQPV